jgi:hypothetical protein
VSGPPYWSQTDQRPKTQDDWTTPLAGTTVHQFTLDSGANRSSIELGITQGRGLRFEGMVNVGTVGNPVNAVEVSGGTLDFDAEDSTGSLVQQRYTGPFLILNQNLLGNDVIILQLRLSLNVDGSQIPPLVTLKC